MAKRNISLFKLPYLDISSIAGQQIVTDPDNITDNGIYPVRMNIPGGAQNVIGYLLHSGMTLNKTMKFQSQVFIPVTSGNGEVFLMRIMNGAAQNTWSNWRQATLT